jgi:hypothetical protein
MLLMTAKRQNIKISVSKDYFDEIAKLLIRKNSGAIWLAETPNKDPVSTEVVIWDNKRAYRWSAASHTDFQFTGATSLLLFNIFQDLQNRGFKEINLMAANTPHLTKFISSFNPMIKPYYSLEKKNLLAEIIGNLSNVLEKI